MDTNKILAELRAERSRIDRATSALENLNSRGRGAAAREPRVTAEKKRGLRGKIIANKTEEMKEELQATVALIQQYIPPDPGMIQVVIRVTPARFSPAATEGRVFIPVANAASSRRNSTGRLAAPNTILLESICDYSCDNCSSVCAAKAFTSTFRVLSSAFAPFIFRT